MSLKARAFHRFHLVDPSPWPMYSSFAAFIMMVGGVMCFQRHEQGLLVLSTSFILLLLLMFTWWNDVICEGLFEGNHTAVVQEGLKLGMVLFIVSEIMFFFAFFWAFFDASLNPNPAIGGVWPPAFMTVLDAWKIPFLNTVILLTSGATLTYAHMAIRHGNKKQAYLGLVVTLVLAVYFTSLQYFEYCNAPFSISDSVYGSVFFLITGFHGIHVMIGSIFLFVSLLRLQSDHFSQEHHLGFEFASWYWHFVDVVWIFVFIVIYLWGA